VTLQQKLATLKKFRMLADFRKDDESKWIVDLIVTDLEVEHNCPIHLLEDAEVKQ